MRIRDRLIKGSLLNFIAMAFNQGSTLLINILIARILLKNTFGEYSLLYSTLLTISTIAQIATGHTAAKYVAEFRTSDPQKSGRIIGLCSLLSSGMAIFATVSLILLAQWLAHSVLKTPHLQSVLQTGSFFLLFSVVNSYQTGALAGLESFSCLAKAGILSGFAALACTIPGAYFGGLQGAIAGLGFSSFLRCIFHYCYLAGELRQHSITPIYFTGLAKEKTVIFKFAIPAALGGYFTMPVIWLANALLARQPNGYSELAIYSSAYSLRVIVLSIPLIINSVSTAILNDFKGQNDSSNYKKLIIITTSLNFILSAVAALIIVFNAESILSIFGKNFTQGKVVLTTLMISSIFEVLSASLYLHIVVQAKIWFSAIFINIPRESIFFVVAYRLIPEYGAEGLGLALATGWAMTLLIIVIHLVMQNYSGKTKAKQETDFERRIY